jgi:hypothetical protein
MSIKYLLDTHTWVWWNMRPQNLSRKVTKLIELPRRKQRGIKPYRFRIALKVIRVIRVICEICGLKMKTAMMSFFYLQFHLGNSVNFWKKKRLVFPATLMSGSIPL